MENDEINNAKEVLKEISQDERERRLTELREKYRMDQNAIMKAGYDKGLKAGIEQGINQGIENGINQGIEQGVNQEKKEIAKRLLKMKMSINQIMEVTGLTKEDVERINNEL